MKREPSDHPRLRSLTLLTRVGTASSASLWWFASSIGWYLAPYTLYRVSVGVPRADFYCWPTFTDMVDISSDYLNIQYSHMHWNRSWPFSSTTGIYFVQELKMLLKTRSPFMNSHCFACWSYLLFVIICFSYMCTCRPGYTLSLVVSFLLISISVGDRHVVVCGMAWYCSSILYTRLSVSSSFIFFKEFLKECTCSAWPFVASGMEVR